MAKNQYEEFVDAKVTPYALPHTLFALNNNGVKEMTITLEDNELHIRINKNYLSKLIIGEAEIKKEAKNNEQ